MAQDPHIRPDGIWDDNWYQQQQKGGGSGGGGGSYPTFDAAAIANQMMEMQRKANEPAIASLQASIPEQQQKYETIAKGLEAKQTPLTQRYDALLKSVTSRGAETLGQTAIYTAREMGRRGISTQSGLAEQLQAERARPIREQISSQEMQLGAEREAALQTLTEAITGVRTGGIEAARAIQNAIATLQAGGASNVISQLPGLYQTQAQAAQNAWLAAQPKTTTLDTQWIDNGDGTKSLVNNQTGAVIQTIGTKKTTSGNGNISTYLAGSLEDMVNRVGGQAKAGYDIWSGKTPISQFYKT